MRAVSLIAFVLLVAACGSSGGNGSGSQAKPTSAQDVASNSSDFASLQKCPESGTWDSYLTAEQTKDPNQYTTDKSDWDSLKAEGANDGYVIVYADSTSSCGTFGNQPTGKAADVYAVRFKDSAAAADNFKVSLKDFHLSDTDLTSIKAAGGTVDQGAATGLGTNSVAVSLAIAGTTLYVAFWQKNQFEVALISYNIPIADGKTAGGKINDRMK